MEAAEFRDAKKKIAKLGARILGISGDATEDLQKFRDRFDLNFPLAGDPAHSMLASYGVWQEKNLYGKKYMGIVRATYIIGPDGRVLKVFPKVKPEGHAAEVLTALKS